MSSPAFVVTRQWAVLFAAIAIAAVLLFIHVLVLKVEQRRNNDLDESMAGYRQRGVKALVMGIDGRASTSKLQVLLWTLAVIYAFVFLLIWGRSIGCGDDASTYEECRRAIAARASFDVLLEEPLDSEYYALLGLPIVAAVAAKVLTQNKVVSGDLVKPSMDATGSKRGFARGVVEIVSRDDGRMDLIDFQYFAFNLLALTYFVVGILGEPSNGLPELPTTLIALTGVAVAAYTGKKALDKDARPVVHLVVPRRPRLVEGTLIEVLGSGFGAAGRGDQRLLIDGSPVDVDPGNWNERKIVTRISLGLAESLSGAGTSEIVVMDAKGAISEAYPIELQGGIGRL
jgi:hypothetical protein